MFERTSLLQNRLGEDLKIAFDENRFPHSVLFCGPSYSGRLTAALDCARVILHTDSLFSKLQSVYAYLSRDLFIGLNAKGQMFLKDKTKSSYVRFCDELFVLMLSRSFSQLRSEDGSKPTLSKESEENLISLYSSLVSVPYDRDNTEDFSKKVQNVLAIVDDIKDESAFSIKDVRIIKKQATLHSSNNDAKIFIIEGLEASLPAGKNAFLKLLEEPPENTYFIVVSSLRKAALGDTILSRLVQYSFNAINSETQKKFFEVYQRNPSAYTSINAFFEEEAYEESVSYKKAASEFRDALINKQSYQEARGLVLKLFGSTRGKSRKGDVLFNIFLNELSFECMNAFNGQEHIAEHYVKAINTAYIKSATYNISQRNTMLSLIDEFLLF